MSTDNFYTMTRLNLVSNKAALANALSNEEPAEDFSENQGVDGGLLQIININ
jgi:hypothetical protein